MTSTTKPWVVYFNSQDTDVVTQLAQYYDMPVSPEVIRFAIRNELQRMMRLMGELPVQRPKNIRP